MNEMCFFELRQRPRWKEACAAWCAEKWSVPLEAYRESMAQALEGRAAVPAWYFCADGPRIVAGLGVIENDFHPRRDLAPNVCAVFTEPAYRGRGIAGRLLALACWRDWASSKTIFIPAGTLRPMCAPCSPNRRTGAGALRAGCWRWPARICGTGVWTLCTCSRTTPDFMNGTAGSFCAR